MPALRKYLETATSVASCDQSAGISASSILKTTSPSAPEIFAGRRVHSTCSSTAAAVAFSAVIWRGTGSPFARRMDLCTSCRGPAVGAPAGRADSVAGSLLPVFAIEVLPSVPHLGLRCGRATTVRQTRCRCQTKPTTYCGDATHNAQGVVCFPQVV